MASRTLAVWLMVAALAASAETRAEDCSPAGSTVAHRIAAARASEAMVRRAPEAAQPALLLAAARLFRGLAVECRLNPPSACLDLQRGRPDLFHWDEPSGSWRYGGEHYRELLERYPGAPEADDAAWEETMLLPKGECELQVDCYVEDGTSPLVRYATLHPRGRWIEEAAALAQQSLRESVDLLPQTPVGESWDRDAGEGVLARCEHAAHRIPARLGAPLLDLLAAYRGKLGQPVHAAALRAEAARWRALAPADREDLPR